MATYEKNRLYQVPLAELQPDPTQPRKYMAPLALEELTASVSQIGIIEPIVCRQDRPRTSSTSSPGSGAAPRLARPALHQQPMYRSSREVPTAPFVAPIS